MKDGYRYKDGKIIVSDYNANNGNIRQEMEREYQDNIKDILITENIIEHFNNLKKEINTKIMDNQNTIYAKKIIMYIKAIPAIFISACTAGFLSAIIKVCLHLGGILPMFSLDIIKLIAIIICSSVTAVFYINKVIKPIMNDIKSLKKELTIEEITLKEINAELERQYELAEKLNNDKRKDDEVSWVHDSLKWVNDYISLDYVGEISKKESNLWNIVAEEEDKIENLQQEQRGSTLIKKLTPPRNTRNK